MGIKKLIKGIFKLKKTSNNTEVDVDNEVKVDVENSDESEEENIPDDFSILLTGEILKSEEPCKSPESNITESDNLAYQYYLLDYKDMYRWHDKCPASQLYIMDHYYGQKFNSYHEHDVIDDYYERAIKNLRKQKLDKLNDN